MSDIFVPCEVCHSIHRYDYDCQSSNTLLARAEKAERLRAARAEQDEADRAWKEAYRAWFEAYRVYAQTVQGVRAIEAEP